MIKFKLEEGVSLPKFETEGAAGFDVTAHSIMAAYKGDTKIEGEKLEAMKRGFERGYIKLRAFERILFGTGLSAEIPEHLELQVRPRSGIALKKGLTVINSPGTVDSDYTGHIGVIIQNTTPFLIQVDKGERIAQIVPKKVEKPELVEIEVIQKETDRGEGGFGSTGTK